MKVVALFAAVGVLLAGSESPEAHRVSLCELIENSARFNGQVVEVDAIAIHDYHSTVLSHPQCKPGVTIQYPTDDVSRPDIEHFLSLRFQGMGRKLTGRFRGIYHDNAGQDPNRFLEHGVPPRVLELLSVTALKIS